MDRIARITGNQALTIASPALHLFVTGEQADITTQEVAEELKETIILR